MKKIFALLLVLTMIFAFVACSNDQGKKDSKDETTTQPTTTQPTTQPTTPIVPDDDEVLTYAEYAAIEVEPGDLVPVVVEFYVQATQGWWDNKITVYGQDADGGYFAYNMVCSEEDAANLVAGTKIRVTGNKIVWEGEYEIAEGATFEFVEGADEFIADPIDVTDLMAEDTLIDYQNRLVSIKGATVAASYDANGNEVAFLYNWDGSGSKGNDLYFNIDVDGNIYNMCVESYLCGKDTAVYQAVESLNIGDAIDLEGFLYWYAGVNPHIIAVSPAA